MKFLDWNISFKCDIQKIVEELKNAVKNDSFIITLQEVKPYAFEYLQQEFNNIASLYYSLDFRKVGKYDTDSRKLGVAIIVSKDLSCIDVGVFNRCLMPDRTLYATIKSNENEIKVVSLHSITGCQHGKAKAIQFLSFTEEIENYQPDIISFDANEPETDHYNISEMKFFDNHDKGNGAKTFFNKCSELNLVDSFLVNYDNSAFIYGKPLTVSHIVGKGAFKKEKNMILYL